MPYTAGTVPYRLIYTGLGLLVVAIVSLAFVFAPRGTRAPLPEPVEAVFPKPNDSVIRQTHIEVDLAVGYDGTLEVDGYPVPADEMTFVEATGVLRWGPSPTGVVLTEWAPGSHTVTVRWNRVFDLPDAGEFTWEFRVQ